MDKRSILHNTMRYLTPILLLTILSNVLNADDIRLKDGTILQNARIVSVNERGVLITHKGGLQQYDVRLVPDDLLSGMEVGTTPKKAITPADRSTDLVGIYALPNSTTAGQISKHLPFDVIERSSGWTKIAIEVWVKDGDIPISLIQSTKTAKPLADTPNIEQTEAPDQNQPEREFKEYDVESISFRVIAGNSKRVRINWSATYRQKTHAMRVIEMQAELFDENYVPLVWDSLPEMHLSGGETVSGVFEARRETFDLCKYIRFKFGNRGSTDFFPFSYRYDPNAK